MFSTGDVKFSFLPRFDLHDSGAAAKRWQQHLRHNDELFHHETKTGKSSDQVEGWFDE